MYKFNKMLYQLPTGKVIEISTEQFLELSDEELEYLIAYNYGEVMENPWFGSILNSKDTDSDITISEIDLINLPSEEKLQDLDIDPELEES